MSNPDQLRAWVEVRLEAIRANYRAIRAAAGSALLPMVKADAYGLGAERVIRALEAEQPWGYGVATVEEGAALRRAGVRRPIVVFGPMPAGEEPYAAQAGLVATVSDVEALARWAAAAEAIGRLDFHLEIDTGMGRSGFDWRETGQWAGQVHALCAPNVRWTGVYTHFHSADIADVTPTRTQWTRFRDALVQLPVSVEDLMVHASNSAAALRWPEYSADAVRPGIFLYGGRAVDPDVSGVARPQAVASVRARLARVREVPPGTTAGYGASYAARSWERWATLPLGYADGVFRNLGNRGEALIHGRRVPIIGRISMDMMVVDITAAPDAVIGDVATLLGADHDEEITVDELAARAGTISYEVLTRLTRRLPRVEC
jgi:alanine racemase